MVIVAIDPGAQGAICILKNGIPNISKVRKNEFGLYYPFLTLHVDAVVIEKVNPYGQRANSAFSFGRAYQCALSYAETLVDKGAVFYNPTPQEWQKEIKKITGIVLGEPKERSIESAKKLYPDADYYKVRGAVDNNKTDALLIAHYGMLKYSLI